MQSGRIELQNEHLSSQWADLKAEPRQLDVPYEAVAGRRCGGINKSLSQFLPHRHRSMLSVRQKYGTEINLAESIGKSKQQCAIEEITKMNEMELFGHQKLQLPKLDVAGSSPVARSHSSQTAVSPWRPPFCVRAGSSACRNRGDGDRSGES